MISSVELRRCTSIMAALSLFALAGATACAQEAGNAPSRGPARLMEVSGLGQADAVPDRAHVRFAVEARGADAASAMNAASDAAGAVIAFLEKSGVEKRAIATSQASLSAEYEYDEDGRDRRLTGFFASNGMTVRLDDLSKVGQIIDGSISAGANRLDGVDFSFQQPQAVLDAARKEAVKDAMRKATLYADAAGLKLGRIVHMGEPGAESPRPMRMEAMAADRAMLRAAPIEPGEATLSATISVTFELN